VTLENYCVEHGAWPDCASGCCCLAVLAAAAAAAAVWLFLLLLHVWLSLLLLLLPPLLLLLLRVWLLLPPAEFLMQMTPLSATTLITVEDSDDNMVADIQKLLKVSPHLLVFWRPEISKFRAFSVQKAKPGEPIKPFKSSLGFESLFGV
jgi:hypothetical protein